MDGRSEGETHICMNYVVVIIVHINPPLNMHTQKYPIYVCELHNHIIRSVCTNMYIDTIGQLQ